jgi:hypothetical protein
MALLLGVAAPSANAAPEAKPGYGRLAIFGAGEITGPFPDTGIVRNGISVDGHGDIVVADEFANQIRLFAPDSALGGVPLSAFPTEIFPVDATVDPSDDAIYVWQNSFWGPNVIQRFVSDGATPPTYTRDPGFEVSIATGGMVVAPTSHDLLVSEEGAEVIRRYDTSGTLVDSITTPGVFPQRLALAPDGSVYAAHEGDDTVYHYSAAGTLLGKMENAGPVEALAVNPVNGILVVESGSNLKRFSSSGALESQSPSRDGIGLTFDGTSERVYEFTRSSVDVYVPATFPGVEVPVVSAITSTGAHVTAEVDPGAGPPEGSIAYFEYSGDNGVTWTPTSDQAVSGPETVQDDLTALVPSSDYLVRFVAKNSLVSQTSSAVPLHTPLAPPEVETGGATSISDSSAELTATIKNTFGGLTTYRFEYGLTTSYGNVAPLGIEADAGNERTPRTFGQAISGLQLGTTYHFRIVAKNAAGESVGADQTFATTGSGPVRAYERVTPEVKQGGSINSLLGFQVADDGAEVSYILNQAQASASSAPLFSRSLSRRSPTGWLDWQPLDPPISVTTRIAESLTHAISPDFTHTVVVSNRALTPVGPSGPYAGGGNIYIQDLDTGEYTFVGGAPGTASFWDISFSQTETIYVAGAPDFSWIIISSPIALNGEAAHRSLYKWSAAGGLEIISRLPDGTVAGNVKATNPYEMHRPQVSEDGNTVYFDLASGDGGVYRRSGGQSTAISVSEIPDDPDTTQSGRLDGISKDGRYAFFRSQAKLTSDTPDLLGVPALYRYDAQASAGARLEYLGLVKNLDDLRVWGVGDDGKIVYFNSGAVDGTQVWNGGVTHTVTVEHPDLGSFGDPEETGGLPIFTSPNGRYMAYGTSSGSLHLYDADRDEDVCVSCGDGNGKGVLTNGNRTISNYAEHVVTDQGEVFFSSRNRLVSDDRNATRDVYMYNHGVLTLISPGDGSYTAYFGDATPDGSSVFFTTDEPLVSGDNDDSVDVYGARIGGGFPQGAPASPECEGEACANPIASPPGLPAVRAESPQEVKFAISGLRPLSSADKRALASGGKARLRLTVSRPGTVTVTGKRIVRAASKAGKAGAISVPFALSKAALSELRVRGSLTVKLTVHFGQAKPKELSIAIRAIDSKKGGRS